MITDWLKVTQVQINGAERLYPKTLVWKLSPGVNAIVGGTALGKTTFVYALQFGIFGKIVTNTGERVERDFFKGRLTNRSAEQIEHDPPVIDVQFMVGDATFSVKRNLLNGVIVEASCDGTTLRSSKYEDSLAERVGLKGDFNSLTIFQSYLLFFGEARYLLAWDNLMQNKILNLVFADHSAYVKLNELWDLAQSADSDARNISAQASRLEKDLITIGGSTSSIQQLEQKKIGKEITTNIEISVAKLASIKKDLKNEHKLLDNQVAEIAIADIEFHKALEKFETDVSEDLDIELFSIATETPTISSVRHALEQFYLKPNNRTCPCCGRPGLAPVIKSLVEAAASGAQNGHCIICSKTLEKTTSAMGKTTSRQKSQVATSDNAAKLQALILKREQTINRIETLKKDEIAALNAVAEARAAEIKFLRENPQKTIDPLRITIDQLRAREQVAVTKKEKNISLLRKELTETNTIFEKIQFEIAEAFKKYATLYLDEACDVEFLKEDKLPGKRGPQIKAPHAAFFPVVSGQTRPDAKALSDAQRSFIDLAFRMAVLDVWHQKTGKMVTMIVETPEGAVDIAYMERVATMLRTFGSQGHTLVITTNLNNDLFLPEIMSAHPQKKRNERILNLLKLGRPRDVQTKYAARFEKILNAVYTHAVVQ